MRGPFRLTRTVEIRTMRSATRLGTLGTEHAYVVLDAAKQLEAAGHRVLHLEIGEPDAPTPPHVVEAGVRALREGRTRYAVAAGGPPPRGGGAPTPPPRAGPPPAGHDGGPTPAP